jgi:hypothetical protein
LTFQLFHWRHSWALGDGFEHCGDSAWDVAEAKQFYPLLDQQETSESVEI